jgi:hypothetical protein
LTLHDPTDPAIVPASLDRPERPRRPWVSEPPRLRLWSRLLLLGLAACWVTVFAVAVSLDPYREDGTALTMETHRQLGLPPCTFKTYTGLPCPSCGMTTSFALLVRGDVWNSVQANFAGTALAALGLVFVPWSIASVTRSRLLGVRCFETLAFRLSIWFLILIFGRWGIAILLQLTAYANP